MNVTFNLTAGHAPAIISTQTMNVKNLCYGIAGADLLIIIGVLIAVNFLASFFWHWLDYFDINIFGRKVKLWRFLPVINYLALIMTFVYTYNLF
jgi:hypothetical protein